MFIRRLHKLQNLARSYELSAEVKEALASQKPVVALESSIITHGMPYPHNVDTAFQVEDIVRQQNAIPATIGIIKGLVKIGLTKDEITNIGHPDNARLVIKASRRDLAYIVSKGLNGGTTVSATIIAANAVGIKVFVTGGIGGVHRGGQDTLDISADLTELGRNPMTVVCSGIKSILDIGRTLEYLETQGVCVATFGPDKEFPAFYTRKSGHQSSYNVDNVSDAAALIASIHKLKLNSGVLLAVPVPACNQHVDNETIEATIQSALKQAEQKGIKGKEVTPFVLSHIAKLTEGLSLQTNIALIKNNALVGAQVAVELQKIIRNEKEQGKQETQPIISLTVNGNLSATYRKEKTDPIVIGACIVDSVVRLQETFKVEPWTLKGHIEQSGGGVGRNIADVLGKLHMSPRFVSAIGRDQPGNYLLSQTLKNVDCDGVLICEEENTASFVAVIDKAGEFRFGVGDMDIHRLISAQHVEKHLHDCPMIIFDGNLPDETITSILKFCINRTIPAVFEPTDTPKCVAPFKTEMWKSLHLISPNMRELRQIASVLGISPGSGIRADVNEIVQEAITLATPLAEHIKTVMVTLGSSGILIVKSNEFGAINGRLYSPLHVDSVVSVSGAGDCAVAGVIAGLLAGLPEAEQVSVGLAAAYDSLHHSSAVPPMFTTCPQQIWHRGAEQYGGRCCWMRNGQLGQRGTMTCVFMVIRCWESFSDSPVAPWRYIICVIGLRCIVSSNPSQCTSFITMSSQSLDLPNPNEYLTSSAGEVKRRLGIVFGTLPYLCTANLCLTDNHP